MLDKVKERGRDRVIKLNVPMKNVVWIIHDVPVILVSHPIIKQEHWSKMLIMLLVMDSNVPRVNVVIFHLQENFPKLMYGLFMIILHRNNIPII